MKPVKTIFLNTLFATTVLCVIFSCNKDNNASPDGTKAGKGYAAGKVTDAKGNPVSGAKILLDNTIVYAAYITGFSGEGGTYSIKMPTGNYGIWKAYATLQKKYHEKTYTLDLHPDNTETFNEDGAVRNFTWKLTGKKPDDEFFYYGGSIRIGPAVGSIIPDNTHITVVLEPDGPLIDGSQGEMITIPYGDARWSDPVEIKDIPIGRYKAIAVYSDQTGDYLLNLQNREKDDGFKDVITFDFEPESRWGYDNTVSLEFHE